AGAAGDVARQAGALQRLEVRAHVYRLVPERREHPFQVSVNDVQIDEQLRSVENIQRLAGDVGHGAPSSAGRPSQAERGVVPETAVSAWKGRPTNRVFRQR